MTDMDKIVQALEMARRVVEYDADCYAPEKLDAAICAARRLAEQQPVGMADLQKQLEDTKQSLAFYKGRCDALQACQSTMRDPERTMVCDILANGSLLMDGKGWLAAERYAERYPQPAAPVAEVPDGVWEALQRMIEDGLGRGQASREDALTVARYRDRVLLLRGLPVAAPQPAAPVAEVPEFMIREVKRAIASAEFPQGMSVHDGKARIGADILRRLLALAAAPQPAQAVALSDASEARSELRCWLEAFRAIREATGTQGQDVSATVSAVTDALNNVVRFIGVDPLAPTKGAALPMIPDSWRFGFSKTDSGLQFCLDDNGPFVAWDSVKDTLAAAPQPAQAVAMSDHELERLTGEPHVDGWPLYSGLPPPAQSEKLSDEERAELNRLRALVNTPELHDFARAVVLEAAHQRERWGSEHDAGKEPQDWFWLLGYLGGKALAAHAAGNTEKALHHTISSAAALANWHAAISGSHTAMRPGIDPEARGIT